jgi:hypothetical protein
MNTGVSCHVSSPNRALDLLDMTSTIHAVHISLGNLPLPIGFELPRLNLKHQSWLTDLEEEEKRNVGKNT